MTAEAGPGDRGGFGALGTTVGWLVAMWAAVIASFPLNDNSFFTHLATGRMILDRGSVPSTDPYTFTAEGVPWTVQSWLPSVVYAAAERIGGGTGLRVVVLGMLLTAGAMLWRLSRPASSVIVRTALVAVGLVIATDLWGERPYMIGVIGLSLVWLALDGAVRPWLLVPVMWFWANSHGSYPLGIALAVLVWVGTVLDDRATAGGRDDVRTTRRVLGMTVLGSLVATAGPLGIEVLTFPLKAVSQSRTLADIVEWQPPDFRSAAERAFLVLFLATVLMLGRGSPWRLTLPAVAFGGAALLSQRNIVMAVVVLVPVLATTAPSVGSLSSRTRPRLGVAASGACMLLAVLVAAQALLNPTTDLRPYPEEAVSWLSSSGWPRRTATQDWVGNFLEVMGGYEGLVFVDDRADMLPADVFGDAVALVDGDAEWEAILRRHGIRAVIWERSQPLGSLLATSPDWQVVYSDTRWIVAERRSRR